jgi:hypothetical protein
LEETAKANERAGILELETARQRERAAAAERSLLELQHRLAWRTLTTEQIKQFVAELSQFAGTRVTLVGFGEIEARRFAEQIVSVLQSAKWSVQTNFMGTSAIPQYGLVCAHPNGDKTAEVFIRLMKEANIDVTERVDPNVQIGVGLKAPP